MREGGEERAGGAGRVRCEGRRRGAGGGCRESEV